MKLPVSLRALSRSSGTQQKQCRYTIRLRSVLLMLFRLLALFRPLAIDLVSLRSFLTLVLGNIRVRLFVSLRNHVPRTSFFPVP